MSDFKDFIELVHSIYGSGKIGLHEPRFFGNETRYVQDAINSTFVSAKSKSVGRFESALAQFVGSQQAVATVNGTSALHLALHLAGVGPNSEVITQGLSFVATANAIRYNQAEPVFLDVDEDTMGLSPTALGAFLDEFGEQRSDGAYNKQSGRRLAAIVPMHTLGFMSRIDEILTVASEWNIPVIEDAAEAIGSHYKGRHSGTMGLVGIYSFNGNKLITAGGGGALVSSDEQLLIRGRHLANTAKQDHPWKYVHDEVGFNFGMPGLNAALLIGQLEKLSEMISLKKSLRNTYEETLQTIGFKLKEVPKDTEWNHWMFSLELPSMEERDSFLDFTNAAGITTRPLWDLIYHYPMYAECYRDEQQNAKKLVETIVCIPSSVPFSFLDKSVHRECLLQVSNLPMLDMENDKIASRIIAPETTLVQAMQAMDQRRMKLLLIVEDEVLIGLITVGDLQRAIIKNKPFDTEVSKLIRDDLLIATADQTGEEVRQVMLHYRLECMPIVDENQKLVDVILWKELFDEPIRSYNKSIQVPVVIMAGGKGTRLKPLTDVIPKALVPVKGKPMIEHIISRFVALGSTQFAISLFHKGEMIEDFLKIQNYQNLAITYHHEHSAMGTAGGLHLVRDRFKEAFFVTNCDILVDEDYSLIYDYHKQSGNKITVVATLRHFEIPYGIVEAGENGKLISLQEKPTHSYLINSGMYILEPEVLGHIPSDKPSDMTDLIDTVSANGEKVGVFPVSEKSWTDVGRISEYRKAQNSSD